MTELEALRAEVNRLRHAMLTIAGCSVCAICKERAFDCVGTPWRTLESVAWTWDDKE